MFQSKEFDHDTLPVTGSQGTSRKRRSASTGEEARTRRKPDSLDTRWAQSRLNFIPDINLIQLYAASQAIFYSIIFLISKFFMAIIVNL